MIHVYCLQFMVYRLRFADKKLGSGVWDSGFSVYREKRTPTENPGALRLEFGV